MVQLQQAAFCITQAWKGTQGLQNLSCPSSCSLMRKAGVFHHRNASKSIDASLQRGLYEGFLGTSLQQASEPPRADNLLISNTELVNNSCFTNKSAHGGLKTRVYPKEAREKLIDICGGYKVCWLALQLSTAAHAYPEELGGGCRQPIFKQNQKPPQPCQWVNICVCGHVARGVNGSTCCNFGVQ